MLSKALVKLKTFLRESKRVYQVTRKPTMKEFKLIVKITGIGILVIGLIGFIVNLVAQLVK